MTASVHTEKNVGLRWRPSIDAPTVPVDREPTPSDAPLSLWTLDSKITDKTSGPVRLDRFLLIERIGAGGVGVVYRAWDPELRRPVALKLLQPKAGAYGDSSATRVLLVREAQAIARLSHPNVVSVFDVGTFDVHGLLSAPEQASHADADGRQRGVFVVMELIEGVTLARWLCDSEPPRSHEIVEKFLAAGQGLVAAHGAGLVHRDFKPQNVMLAEDGRVRVLDFGLALVEERPGNPADAPTDPAHVGPTDLTQSGVMMGTPHYMAPEQHVGKRGDARSDQYAFCVALFQALYRELPFPGETPAEILERKVLAKPTPPASSRVPTRIFKVIRRGLSVDPDRRFPSMAALLAELERVPGRLGRRLGFAAAVALAGAAFSMPHDGHRCAGAAEKLDGNWDRERRTLARAAFVETDVVFAGDTWDRVEGSLDDYAQTWAGVYGEACEAMERDASTIVDQQMACLDHRVGELGALVRVFGNANPTVVERAVAAVARLEDPSTCADGDALSDEAPPGAVEADDVERVRGLLAEARALQSAGRYDDARLVGENALAVSETLDYAPAKLDAMLTVARVLYDTQDLARAQALLEDAYWQSMSSGRELTAIKAASRLVHLVGYLRDSPDDGLKWREPVEALMRKVAVSDEVEAQYHNHVGIVVQSIGDYGGALDHFEHALAAQVGATGTEHPTVVAMLNNIGALHVYRKDFDAARGYLDRSAVLGENIYGTDHPSTAGAISNAAGLAGHSGRHGDALVLYGRALELHSRLGLERREVARALYNLALINTHLGRMDEALAHEARALHLTRRMYGDEDPQVADVLYGIGFTHLERDARDEAAGYLEEALRIYETTRAGRARNVAHAKLALAQALWPRAEERQRALELAQDSIVSLRRLGHRRMLAFAEGWLAERADDRG